MDKPFSGSQQAPGLHLLICPFAGGSASAFRGWQASLPAGISMSLAVWPGRDHRMRETCATSIDALADDLLQQPCFTQWPPRQLIIVGHSMGAQVAFAACRRLEQRNTPPRGLVLSGCHAPHLRGRRPISHLADAEFIAQLVAMGGCAQELIDEPTLWPVFMPMLRADFTATEAWHDPRLPQPAERLQTPTLLVCGSADAEASANEVAAWQAWLRCHHGPVSVAGDHFYITRRPAAFLEHIRRCFDTGDSHADACTFR
ncbi:thioesterase II family protein [Erwinia mallotivora]|uniref:thioesterase II family protein n=1 Tax=Erwinia mallotivora TaxID=69222 RepID=UPI0021BF1DE7|nr:alpha/beta fold hydrolase [Erwinia mallotivora]